MRGILVNITQYSGPPIIPGSSIRTDEVVSGKILLGCNYQYGYTKGTAGEPSVRMCE